MRRYKEFEVLPSRTETTTGNLDSTNVTNSPNADSTLVLYLDVTAASGTSPTLDIDVIALVNGKEYTLDSFAQKTAVSTERLVITNAPRDVNLDWAIAGTTPSFTFNIQAHRY